MLEKLNWTLEVSPVIVEPFAGEVFFLMRSNFDVGSRKGEVQDVGDVGEFHGVYAVTPLP
jgi:hypothetical protein